MKKFTKMFMALGVSAVLAACGNGSSSMINVITREEGSGTRDAFTEITGVADGDEDYTVQTADVQNGTDQVLSNVASNPAAIGYISLGSLNDTVKAVKIDDVEATEENVSNGDYPVQRPFNVVTKKDGELSDVAQDFMDFILSKQGQEIVLDHDYVPLDTDTDYEASGQTGTIKVSGSTSVGPLMESLAEEYKKLNSGVEIEITQNGSSAGVEAAGNGSSDLGMASRELKAEETDVESTVIAKDGIAVIVNKENTVDNLTLDDLKAIFTGESVDWTEFQSDAQ
ncbi:substrate-binding domain-containing protein [Aerococcus vaginalis]